MNRVLRAVLAIGAVIFAAAWQGSFARTLAEDATFDPAVRPEFSEPVVLASKDGVLEVRLTVKQGEVRLDTVAAPVKNFLVFAYEVIRGTASNGQTRGRQSLSRADIASVPRGDADRPLGQRHDRAHDPRFLRSAIYREGR